MEEPELAVPRPVLDAPAWIKLQEPRRGKSAFGRDLRENEIPEGIVLDDHRPLIGEGDVPVVDLEARGVFACTQDKRERIGPIGQLKAGERCSSVRVCLDRAPLEADTSESAPVGLYRIDDARVLASGDMVLARVPWRFRRLAAERRYVPSNVPLVKRVAAVPGDRVCGVRGAIFINGTFVGTRAARDARGRPMPWWNGCVVLGRGAYFLLMESPASFDGRYFGPTRRADIIGRATPMRQCRRGR